MVTIKIPWDREGSLALVRSLCYLGVRCRFNADNGHGSILIEMDDEADAAILALWEAFTDLRERYIEARQAEAVEQLSYLEGE